MNPTGRTPTGAQPPRGSLTPQAADQRGGANPNLAPGTQNVVQLPMPHRTLRATNPNPPTRTDAHPGPARPRTLNNPPRPQRRNRVQKPQRGKTNPNATGRTQTMAKLLALGRTLRAATPNPRARFGPNRRPAPKGQRTLNNPPRPRRRNRVQKPQRGKTNLNATGRTQTMAKLLALGRTLRAATPNRRARFAAYRRPASKGLRILDHQPQATGAEERI